LLPIWINGKYYSSFKGINVSVVMDKKENNIDSKELNVSSENPTFDLKAIRESMGLTLREVSSSTRVSLSNLKAIEDQAFGLLPEPIYARAFIGAYAHALDIDGEEILSLYDKSLEDLEPDENRNEILKKLAWKKRHTKFWIWLAIASCVIILTGVLYLYQWSKDDSHEMRGRAPVGEIENAGELQEFSGDVSAPDKDGITIEEDGEFGMIDISSQNKEDIEAAKDRIKMIIAVPEVGEVYLGKVKTITNFGAFIEIIPGKDGLLHISEVDWKRTEDVEKVLTVGQELEVKLIGLDPKTGKLKLSRKVLLPKPE